MKAMMDTLTNPDFRTPVYVFDEDAFIANANRMTAAFKKYYPNFKIAYSYKTNYANHICKLADSIGCYAEVVSPMEVQHALDCGVEMSNIVYNGVIRNDGQKFVVAQYGGKVNVDNIDELVSLNKIAESRRIKVNIGVRLNFDIGNGLVSRFGIDTEGEDFAKMIAVLKDSKYLKLVGVHCHISKAREIEFWKERVRKMVYYIRRLETAGVLDLQYIDLGSNMYAPMEKSLAKQFGDKIPSYGEYARVICKKIRNAFKKERPLLIVEPGTPLVANTVGVLSTVVGIKEVQGKTFATMDCSKFNLGAISGVKNVPIKVFHNSKGMDLVEADLVGFTCIEDDVVNRNYTGKLAVGDRILFKNVGAYSNTFAPQFIMPVIGMITDNGKEIKERDDYRRPFENYR